MSRINFMAALVIEKPSLISIDDLLENMPSIIRKQYTKDNNIYIENQIAEYLNYLENKIEELEYELAGSYS